MFFSFFMGAVAGARSMAPLAAVSIAAWRRTLPQDNGAPELLGHPLVAAGTVALAVAEMAGDKMDSAPERTVVAGLLGRIATGAIVGMALAPREQRYAGAAVGAVTAVAASFLTLAVRLDAMERHGQTPTGLVEDAIVTAGAISIMRAAQRASAPSPGRAPHR
jgi:uncharacterized membrane protein